MKGMEEVKDPKRIQEEKDKKSSGVAKRVYDNVVENEINWDEM
jgi:hypothetical protein